MGSAVLTITLNNNNVQASNFGNNSFKLTNTGDKNIASVEIDVTNALYPDAVFDPFGVAGDTIAKVLTINTSGGTGVIAPNNNPNDPNNQTYIGAGGIEGFKGIRLFFDENASNGFEPGETVGFAVDMDSNSIAGSRKTIIDSGTNPNWDVGGVSGAELIGSTFTVTFTDGSTASGQLQSNDNQAGSKGLATQDAQNLNVALTVNGLNAGGMGTYNGSGPNVIVNGPAGQTARVVLTKGFIQPVVNNFTGPYAAQLDHQLADLAASDYPANNAVENQTVDVVLTGGNQNISNQFDFSGVPLYNFAGEDQLPLGFVASIIDPANDDLPIGPVSRPIYLEFDGGSGNSNTPPIATFDTGSTNENAGITLNVLNNDTDANGDQLTITNINASDTLGQVTNNGDGTLRYNPNGQFDSLNAGETATDRFFYTVSDGNGGSDTAAVTVTINGLDSGGSGGIPITIEAEDLTNTTGYRLENKGVASGGQMLSLLGQSSGEVGTATFTFNGASGDYNVVIGTFDENDGNASIEFLQGNNLIGTANLNQNPGGNGASADTKVEKTVATNLSITSGTRFTVQGNENGSEHARFDFIRFEPLGGGSGPNTPPIATFDTGSTNENAGITLNVLNNDTDANGDQLTITNINASDTLGQVTNNGDGTLRYNPNGQFDSLNAGETATDRFFYTVSDGNGGSDTAAVTVTVNGVSSGGPSGTPITIEAESIDSLSNSSVSGYRIETKGFASGGAMLSLVGGASNEVGTVALAVDDLIGFASGTAYDVNLGTFNENDGQASFTLERLRNGSISSLGQLILDAPSGSNLANATTQVTLGITNGVTLQSGDILTITGNENLQEHARLDFIELTPV